MIGTVRIALWLYFTVGCAPESMDAVRWLAAGRTSQPISGTHDDALRDQRLEVPYRAAFQVIRRSEADNTEFNGDTSCGSGGQKESFGERGRVEDNGVVGLTRNVRCPCGLPCDVLSTA